MERTVEASDPAAATAPAVASPGDGDDPVRLTPDGWRELEPGLDVRRFHACGAPSDDATGITVARIDPARFRLVVLAASSAPEGAVLPIPRWATDHDLVIATNAGMFHEDYRRHVGFMTVRGHVNNGIVVGHYKSALALDPVAAPPGFELADLDETPIDELRARYPTVVQNLRMIAGDGRNVWRADDPTWGIAAFGVDSEGRPLFVFGSGTQAVSEFSDCLLELPIDIARAQYLEGGPEAALVVRSTSTHWTIGASGRGTPDDAPLPVPNVLGVVRR